MGSAGLAWNHGFAQEQRTDAERQPCPLGRPRHAASAPRRLLPEDTEPASRARSGRPTSQQSKGVPGARGGLRGQMRDNSSVTGHVLAVGHRTRPTATDASSWASSGCCSRRRRPGQETAVP